MQRARFQALDADRPSPSPLPRRMLSKLFVPITLLATALLAIMVAFAPHEAQAVSSILLGYCTSSTTGCGSEFEVYGDPSWDQPIPSSDSHGNAIVCASFKRTTEYNIKVCGCGDSCQGCSDSQCEAPARNGCVGGIAGPFKAICSVRIAVHILGSFMADHSLFPLAVERSLRDLSRQPKTLRKASLGTKPKPSSSRSPRARLGHREQEQTHSSQLLAENTKTP